MKNESQEQTSMISNQLEREQYIQDILDILKKYGVSIRFDYSNVNVRSDYASNPFTAEVTEDCQLSDKTIKEIMDILTIELRRGIIE